MKTYKPLIIPEDSAWGRKTLSARIWRILPYGIRSFLTGCKNVIRWSPTIFKDRDWDDWYIYNILQKKIEFQRKEIIYANRHTQVDLDNRDMTIALNLIERVKEDYYGIEYLDYSETKFRFDPIEGDDELYTIEQDVISENYGEYIKKYPSSVRKVLKEKPDLDKKDICFWVAQHNEEKAHDLLHKVLKEKMRGWWD
jgi:hypothetical protein